MIAAPPLNSSDPVNPPPIVTPAVPTDCKVVPVLICHCAEPANSRSATVPVPVIDPPLPVNSARSSASGGVAAGVSPSPGSFQFVADAKAPGSIPNSLFPTQTRVLGCSLTVTSSPETVSAVVTGVCCKLNVSGFPTATDTVSTEPLMAAAVTVSPTNSSVSPASSNADNTPAKADGSANTRLGAVVVPPAAANETVCELATDDSSRNTAPDPDKPPKGSTNPLPIISEPAPVTAPVISIVLLPPGKPLPPAAKMVPLLTTGAARVPLPLMLPVASTVMAPGVAVLAFPISIDDRLSTEITPGGGAPKAARPLNERASVPSETIWPPATADKAPVS